MGTHLGPVDPALDAAACPGGCTIAEGLGHCEAMQDLKAARWRWCQGYHAFVCAAAFEAWEAEGRPSVSDAALRTREPERPADPQGLGHPPISEWARGDAWEGRRDFKKGASGDDA
jgi:hypothetical protein